MQYPFLGILVKRFVKGICFINAANEYTNDKPRPIAAKSTVRVCAVLAAKSGAEADERKLDSMQKLDYLVPQQIFKHISFTYQLHLSVCNHYLRRFVSAVKVAAHFKTISAGIIKNEQVAFPYFI